MDDFKDFKKQEKTNLIKRIVLYPFNNIISLYKSIYKSLVNYVKHFDIESFLMNLLVIAIVSIIPIIYGAVVYGDYLDQEKFYEYVKNNKVTYSGVDDDEINFTIRSKDEPNVVYYLELHYIDERCRIIGIDYEKDLDPNGSMFYDEMYEYLDPYIDDVGRNKIKK